MGVDEKTTVAEAMLAEQAAFASVLHDLTPDQWDLPSLCPDWLVRDVVRHAAFHIHREGLRQTLGSTERWEAILAEAAGAGTDDGLMAWFESPPPESATTSEVNLAEVVIHQLDVRRAVGAPRAIPESTLRRVLDQCVSVTGNFFVVGRRRRLSRDLQLVATDLDWTTGTGPLVTGTAEDLLLGIAGRSAVYAELSGPGVEVMAHRQTAEKSF